MMLRFWNVGEKQKKKKGAVARGVPTSRWSCHSHSQKLAHLAHHACCLTWSWTTVLDLLAESTVSYRSDNVEMEEKGGCQVRSPEMWMKPYSLCRDLLMTSSFWKLKLKSNAHCEALKEWKLYPNCSVTLGRRSELPKAIRGGRPRDWMLKALSAHHPASSLKSAKQEDRDLSQVVTLSMDLKYEPKHISSKLPSMWYNNISKRK